MSKNLIERYRSLVDTSLGVDACWSWRGGLDTHGYGQISDRGRKRLCHRLAVELVGRATAGLVVRHRCDNPRCVNPIHLELGTQLENIRDRDLRGRTRPGRGERHGKARLSDAAVREMRAWYAVGGWTQRAVADAFEISHAQGSKILAGSSRRTA